jgi:hypothetical protein
MAQKITITLEDDLDGGPADETVRFAIGGAGYEIDLSASNTAAFRRSWHRSSPMPARQGGNHGGPAVMLRAGSAAAISGRGPRTRASLSANGAASPLASWANTKPPPNGPDASR